MDLLRISMVGLSRWESEFVQTTVNLASGMDIAPWRFVEDPNGADVLLVDAHRHAYKAPAERKDSRRPIVVSFCQDSDAASVVEGRGLARPVGYTDLIGVLKDIEHELQNVTEKPKPTETVHQDADLPEPEVPAEREPVPVIWEQLFDTADQSAEILSDMARPARRFVEGTRLLGILKRILQWRTPAEITHARFPTVLVFPEQNAFLSSGTPTSIPRMFRDSALSFTVREVPALSAASALSTRTHQPLNHLIYCAALFGSEGRLLLHSNPEDRLRLIDWPDFDAVPHLPEHRDIAKFMLVNAASLSDIADSTGVGTSVVIDFCNACEAVGLVRRIPPGEPGPVGDIVKRDGSPLLGRVRDLFKES